MPVARLQPKEYVQKLGHDTTAYSETDALEYTRWLATNHYENFQVVSFMLPRELHEDFYNVYAFCRWADDLGDEIGDPAESLRLLSWWRKQLQAMYRGEASHPVFVALRKTVIRHDIPIEPFDRLIQAFEQDQTVTRYGSFDDVIDYCVNSANPVGHLVLYLCGYRDAERFRLSDNTCTGLQLANHWQDVTVDLRMDRVYLPLELLAKHGYTLEELFARKYNDAFCSVMAEAVDVAEDFFRNGLPLVKMVDRRLSLDLDLFSHGGLKILRKIRLEEYDVLKQRPYISKAERLGILFQCLRRQLPF
ncbi:MAG: squalene synthase HpnC [Acidobacteriota bacterium]|nr:squalene synthase HpnC [Acidobacteriota bacterium]